ncbi:ATP-grasp domain-containing protein [Cellulosilyticum ruminicola]|uniref:ATP-grasp domain-containing protein n=1 Tax=Cellulosilyticum ruminicola TaxID=425254 RepID=UPI0006D2C732|nr:ATP-grasp domain-containing protein [Cellulosilyticum ruminicola]
MNSVKRVGIVGGGVSTLMLCIEAAKVGIATTLLDPKVDCIGAQIATEHILATITNESIEKLSLRVDAIVFNTKLEFPLECRLHCKTYPSKTAMDELSNPKGILELLEILEIPTAPTYYQDNKEMVFEKIENISLPFNFIKQYGSRSELKCVENHEDMADFILDMDENIDSFAIQLIPEYAKTIISIVIVDEAGKAQIYDPLEVVYEAKKICRVKVADDITKTMTQKIARLNRKVLKELQGAGVYTIKYGIKANKSLEFVEITPEIDMAALLTLEAHNVSIYEQYMHMLMELSIVAPTLETYAHGHIKESDKPMDKNKPYHMYNLGLTNLCITRNSIEK